MRAVVLIMCSDPCNPDCGWLDDELPALLAAQGLEVLLTPELYHITEDDEVWKQLAAGPVPLRVLCPMHPRPARWLLCRHGIELPEEAIIDVRTVANADEALERMTLPDPSGTPGTVRRIAVAVANRWYPIIDLERCINCGHCREFCIFGVYTLDGEGQVIAAEPDNCKPGCPACARICPQSAIMFALHPDDAGIQGAPGASIAPDPTARRMYYHRTQAACPVCGQSGPVAAAGDGDACDECGRPRAGARARQSPVIEQIDALIDQLDRLTDGS